MGLKSFGDFPGSLVTYGDAVQDLERIKAITRIAYEGGINFSITPTYTPKGWLKS